MRARLMYLAGNRLTREGELAIETKRFHTQERDRQDAINRLVELIRRASEQPSHVSPPGPCWHRKSAALEGKKQRGEIRRGVVSE